MASPKTGILLLNLGGPDSLEAVKPFLYNLFSDPDIIKLPFSEIFQKPLAWYISTEREHEAQRNYRLMGGKSPILDFTQAQGEALQQALAEQGHGSLPIYVAMRYWHPLTEAAVDQMIRDGIERLIVLPLYPHFSYTTTGSSLNELKRVMEARNFRVPITVVPPYYNHPSYLQAVAETIRVGMETNPWGCPPEEIQLLFSAHSLPIKHVKRTKDPYPQHILHTARTIAEQAFPGNPWELCYQSQVGKMQWLGPSVDGALHYFAGKNIDNILVVAISFVSDHVETLVEIDNMYLPLARELKIQYCHRAPALNTRPAFIQTITELVTAELEKPPEESMDSQSFPELLKAQAAG
ncbi:MAG TPA: ferrochelatase [Coleofasciculaceae cyanobacterium]|jgi:ferrochelatase